MGVLIKKTQHMLKQQPVNSLKQEKEEKQAGQREA